MRFLKNPRYLKNFCYVLICELFSFFCQIIYFYLSIRYRQAWGSDKFDAAAPIPAFLTGNMWAQEWQNTFSLVSPYPDVPDQVRRVKKNVFSQVLCCLKTSKMENNVKQWREMGIAFETAAAATTTPKPYYDETDSVKIPFKKKVFVSSPTMGSKITDCGQTNARTVCFM